MLVKSLKGANEDSSILQDTSHSIVNVLQHLATLTHSLQSVKEYQWKVHVFPVSLSFPTSLYKQFSLILSPFISLHFLNTEISSRLRPLYIALHFSES